MKLEIAYPWIYWLLPLPLLVYFFLPPLKKRRSGLLVPFFEKAAQLSQAEKRKSACISRHGIPAWLALIGCWLCLLTAASSPRRVGLPQKTTKTVRSFLIVADLSFSMAQVDWALGNKPCSRWEAVRTILKDFVRDRKSDKMGLVLFATHPYLQAPLTTDLAAVQWLLDQSEVGMAGQFTSIGEAISYSASILKKDSLKKKVMLLLTDGIDEGKSINPMDAARLAGEDTITIYTLGIGKAAGSGGYSLDEQTLRNISAATKGRYFNAMNQQQLKTIYQELDKIEPVKYEEEQYRPVQLLYIYPLAAALIFGLAFEFIRLILAFIKKISDVEQGRR